MTSKEKIQWLIDNAVLYTPDKTLLTDDLPDTVAAAFEAHSKVSHHYNSIDNYSIYSKDQYQKVVDDKEIRLHIRKFLSKCKLQRKSKKGEVYAEKFKKQSKGFVGDVNRYSQILRG